MAPIGSATVICPGPTEVASTAAQSSSTLGVDDGATSLAIIGGLGWSRWGCRGFLGKGAIAKAGLAAVSAVEGLVLDLDQEEKRSVALKKHRGQCLGCAGRVFDSTYIVLRTTMSSRAAATVEVTIRSGTRAAHTTLSMSADIDIGDGGGILTGSSCGCGLKDK